MEYIFDYPDEVMALYACGHTFRQSVRIADCMDDECCERIRLCISNVFGKFEHGEVTLMPNYHDEVVTEVEARFNLVNTIRESFSGALERALPHNKYLNKKEGGNKETIQTAQWLLAMFACGCSIRRILRMAEGGLDEENMALARLCTDIFWGPFDDVDLDLRPYDKKEPIREQDIRDALVRLFRDSRRKRLVKVLSGYNGKEWMAFPQEDDEDAEEISIAPDCEAIGDYAYAFCTKVTTVEIPRSVKVIGEAAFKGCSGLTRVVIPDSVTLIGDHAFEGCTGLTRVVVPESVTKIGKMTFNGCPGLAGSGLLVEDMEKDPPVPPVSENADDDDELPF
jgi:hypothetical protein